MCTKINDINVSQTIWEYNGFHRHLFKSLADDDKKLFAADNKVYNITK